jgi:hypothetical protein
LVVRFAEFRESSLQSKPGKDPKAWRIMQKARPNSDWGRPENRSFAPGGSGH